jgi:hypothetical protein
MMPAVFDMPFSYRSQMAMASPALKIEFTAAHEEVTPRIGTDVLAFLVEQLRVANRAVVPPIVLGVPRRWQFNSIDIGLGS